MIVKENLVPDETTEGDIYTLHMASAMKIRDV
jgi:hypothetical protein